MPIYDRWNDNPFVGKNSPPERQERAAKLSEAMAYYFETGSKDKLKELGLVPQDAEDAPVRQDEDDEPTNPPTESAD